MPKQVAVFIDYQNAFNLGRLAFDGGTAAAPWCGQFHPLALATELVNRRPDRELAYVRIYRGMPDSRKQPKGNSACSRQIDGWSKLPGGLVRVTWRPLRYPRTWPAEKAEEKGIDVQLAVDFIRAAMKGEYQVGILFSGDSDMKPVLFAVEEILGQDAIEVAAWNPAPPAYPIRVSLGGPPNRRPYCHMLDETFYRSIADPRDYTKPI